MEGRVLLELEDLARHYRHPCIVDIKVAGRTQRAAGPSTGLGGSLAGRLGCLAGWVPAPQAWCLRARRRRWDRVFQAAPCRLALCLWHGHHLAALLPS